MTRNMTRKTEVRDVSFESHGAKLAGRLYLPSLPDGQRPPVIIVMGSWMTVKEQMPANYAPLLAEAGSAALTFDFRGFGKSEGSPREVESAQRKAEDIRAAVAFLRQNDQVDGQRVGVLPICASSMYTVMAAQQEPGIKSVAMVAPWIHNSNRAAHLWRRKRRRATAAATALAQLMAISPSQLDRLDRQAKELNPSTARIQARWTSLGPGTVAAAQAEREPVECRRMPPVQRPKGGLVARARDRIGEHAVVTHGAVKSLTTIMMLETASPSSTTSAASVEGSPARPRSAASGGDSNHQVGVPPADVPTFVAVEHLLA